MPAVSEKVVDAVADQLEEGGLDYELQVISGYDENCGDDDRDTRPAPHSPEEPQNESA